MSTSKCDLYYKKMVEGFEARNKDMYFKVNFSSNLYPF